MKLVVCSILFSLLIISMVSAIPPVTTTQHLNDGFLIVDSPQITIKQSTDHIHNFFVYNLTNGLIVSNITTECFFYLSDNSGKVDMYNSVPYYPLGYWGITINKSNFSEIGLYNYGIKCQSNSTGGAISGYFEVTYTGEEVTLYHIILPIALLVLGIIIFIIGFTFSNDKVIIKTGFYLTSLILGIIAINSARLIVSNSASLLIMSFSGLIILISITLVMFLYVFINWMVQTINVLNQKEKLKWEY